MPQELEKALDETTKLGMMRRNMDVYTQMAQADALKETAKNPGMAGTAMGAGFGWGMGMNMGKMFGNAPAAPVQSEPAAQSAGRKCSECGAALAANAKFCPECGTRVLTACPKCGAKLPATGKFCPECGEKIR